MNIHEAIDRTDAEHSNTPTKVDDSPQTRQVFADALKRKLELTGNIDGSIRLQVIGKAYKLLLRGVDRYTFIEQMSKASSSMGDVGKAVITEIGMMPEYKEWND